MLSPDRTLHAPWPADHGRNRATRRERRATWLTHNVLARFGLAGALMLMAGCGSVLNSAAGNSVLAVDVPTHTVLTGGQLHFSAMMRETGEPAKVRWQVSSSANAATLGAGTIDANGVYTPPGALSANQITVEVTASLMEAPAPRTLEEASALRSITTSVIVRPGFVQPLQPENAAVAAGQSIEVHAQIAEVNSGSVVWSLRATPLDPSAGAQPASTAQGLGTLGPGACQRSSQQFTTCTVTYTASAAPVSGAPASVYLVATANPSGNTRADGVAATSAVSGAAASSLHLLLTGGGVSSNPAAHQAEQRGPVILGSSGSNDNDFDTYQDKTGASYIADCCGGTLGALVRDGAGTAYILSNDHVLAESDQAKIGDSIDQPGVIDDGCAPLSQAGARLRSIGALKYAVPLARDSTNVDAALATVAPGLVDPGGSILELGAPSAGALGNAPPVAGSGEVLDATRLSGLQVAKSGRTTGLTCSTVDAVDLSVKVDYYKDCAETQPYTTKTFTGQFGIMGDGFSDSGDSGALVVDAANAQPVGLFYASGTDGAGNGLSIANPIGDVLSELGKQAGSSLSIVGTNTPHRVACLNYGAGSGTGSPSSAEAASVVTASPAILPSPSTAGSTSAGQLSNRERARTAAAVQAASGLVAPDSGILGVLAGVSADHRGEGAVMFFLDKDRPSITVPGTIENVRTAVIRTDAAGFGRAAASASAAGESGTNDTRAPASLLAPVGGGGIRLSAVTLANAREVAARVALHLMADPAIFGVGVAQSLDDPSQPALFILIDSSRALTESTSEALAAAEHPGRALGYRMIATGAGPLPPMLDGLRVRYVTMHRFRVTQSKYVGNAPMSGCALRGMTRSHGWSATEAAARLR